MPEVADMHEVGEAWFIPVPEESDESQRATLDLELNKARRHYRELVVPGIGGVGFVRQLSWAVAGIMLAQERRKSAISIANAIEALACKLEWRENEKPNRIKGKRAFQRYEDALGFKQLTQRKYYVLVPFRVSTSRALVGLGLAQGTRFNSMTLTEEKGEALAGLLLNQQSGEEGGHFLRTILSNWIDAGTEPPGCRLNALPRLLSPNKPTAHEKKLVGLRLSAAFPPGDFRRHLLIKAFGSRKTQPDTKDILDKLGETQRMQIETALAFDELHDAAQQLVHSCVTSLGNGAENHPLETLASKKKDELDALGTKAEAFLDKLHQSPASSHRDAERFAQTIQSSDNTTRLKEVVERDGNILALSDANICRGHLFATLHDKLTRKGKPSDATTDGTDSEDEYTESSSEKKITQLFSLWRDCQ